MGVLFSLQENPGRGVSDVWELELSRILREILAAGAARNWDKMIALAKELEQLAIDERGGNPDGNPGQ